MPTAAPLVCEEKRSSQCTWCQDRARVPPQVSQPASPIGHGQQPGGQLSCLSVFPAGASCQLSLTLAAIAALRAIDSPRGCT